METLLEFGLMLLWDLFKTLILQWLINKTKEWWESRKNYDSLQSN